MARSADPRLVLASASPRRRDLLHDSGYLFDIVASRAAEIECAPLSVRELTLLNAVRKTRDIAQRYRHRVVLGADTLVSLDGAIMTKPVDLADARRILRRLSGRTHQVCTSIAAMYGARVLTRSEISHVTFRSLTDHDIGAYPQRVDVLDKAGAYAAQNDDGTVIARIDGSFSNVVGLPMEVTREVLAAFGVEPKAR